MLTAMAKDQPRKACLRNLTSSLQAKRSRSGPALDLTGLVDNYRARGSCFAD